MTGRVAVVADRIGWEERRLIEAAAGQGLTAEWVNDESLCLGGQDAPLHRFDAVLVRSRSYTRGGLVATLTEAAGIPTLNTASAIRTCENKLDLRTALRHAGVPVADFRLVLSRKDYRRAITELGTPFVLKPIFGGMGKRVTLVRSADVAQSVYDYVEDLGHGFEQASLAEPYLAAGTSIRCFVVGRQVVATAEFASAGEDWRSNAALGNRRTALDTDPAVTKIVDDVIDVIGPGIYGIDLFRVGGEHVVNEVNHAPAFRGVTEATGTDVPAIVVEYVKEVLA
ncbi:RimK family alpha-L-glutamate ligase [Myceligenerans crystallogenes]|uniref:Lysine biosynthesis protein LysX n=1 Tax=Myceligenerans crystallogenes TaxID=316335 RepID=A0ABP4ZM92_9MICO